MQVSHEESLANYFGLQRRGGSGNRFVLSVRAKGNAGQPLSSPFYACNVLLEQGHHFRVPILLCQGEGHIERTVIGKVRTNTAESKNLCMRGHSKRACVLWKTGREVRLVSTGNEKR